MSIRLETIPALDRQTDSRAEMVKQYRALHALYRMLACDEKSEHVPERFLNIHLLRCNNRTLYFSSCHSK